MLRWREGEVENKEVPILSLIVELDFIRKISLSLHINGSCPRDNSQPLLRAFTMKKKASWLSRGRSFGRKRSRNMSRKSSSGTSATIEEDARDSIEETRRDSDSSRNPPASPVALRDGDLSDDDDESYINSSYIHDDRSLYSLAPIEKSFINNTISRLQLLGHGDHMDVHSVGMLLRDICALEKPFESLQLDDDESFVRHSVNIYPLWARLEHSLSRYDDVNSVNPVAIALTKSSICAVLKDMNITVINESSARRRRKSRGKDTKQIGSWGNPPFMSSWDSMSYCHCSLF